MERVIGSIHRECHDCVIVANAALLQQVLTGFIGVRRRAHLALDKDLPISRPVVPPSVGGIVATLQVRGLHPPDDRAAA